MDEHTKKPRHNNPIEAMCWVLTDPEDRGESETKGEEGTTAAGDARGWRAHLPWGSNFLRTLSLLRGGESRWLKKRSEDDGGQR
jgi:hypothetical protein